MRDFGYTARGRAVNEAQAEVHVAFAAVVNRNDEDDPRTKRWHDAIAAFRAASERVYSDPLQQFDQGIKRVSEIDTVDMLDFLEADPVFYGSGYMKEKLLRELKRRKMDSREVERIRAIIINIIRTPDHHREFSDYCRVATAVADERFRDEIESLARSRSTPIALRASCALMALDGEWVALKRALRAASMRYWKKKYPDGF